MPLVQSFKRFVHGNDGGVVTIVAVALPILMGFGALALEYGLALVTKSKNQRVADLAAYAGGLEFKRISGLNSDEIANSGLGTEENKQTAIKAAAIFVAEKNGVSITDPVIGADFEYIEVTVSADQFSVLARPLLDNIGIAINSSARVSFISDEALTPCFHANGEMRFNGSSSTLEFANCGITSNDIISLRGNYDSPENILSTTCGAVNGVEAVGGKQGCEEVTTIASIEDPFENIYDLCSSGYKELIEFAEEEEGSSGPKNSGRGGQGRGGSSSYELEPGPLCVTTSDKRGRIQISETFKSKEGASNVLIVDPEVTEIKFTGQGKLEITALSGAEYSDYGGVAIYAPSTEVVLSGNAKSDFRDMNCFGFLVGSVTGNGGIDLRASCDDESRFVSEERIRLTK